MLPFSSFEFFIIMAIFVAIVVISKYILTPIYYKHLLAILNLLFISVIYPKPYHFILLILFSFIFTYLITDIFKIKKKIWGILILLLPMLLVKLDIRFDFYPFELNNIISFAGLSYASFRIMGYFMDKAPNEKMADFISYFNFLSFTPTLLIGPIDRFGRFKSSQDNGFASINIDNFIIGWNSLVKGIVFKFIIAEIIDRYWMNIYPESSKEIMHMANNMYSYYFYLFFDFAGYSFMALGIGKMMGMNVPVNFTNPFLAVNPQDFWRRFHISLGEWLKDYFFTPLYMFLTRKKSLKKYPIFRQNLALILTFLLMGCWNGFKFNYILSGTLLGVFSAIHNTYLIQCKKKGKDVVFGNLNPLSIKIISIILVFNSVAFALYIFSGRFPFLN
ncbi:MAG: D-alanyl transfer protein [Bacteroidetes bacterium CG_4_10_14_3_um_filter_31_20]|nr:MAG: D-alanyl transfer protein [Bacteroidetes bacterium CG_4_10_14_3_um_filter_31_20]